MSDELPPQRNNLTLEREERIRDLLVEMGLQEVVNYRLTSPDREARRLPSDVPPDDKPYLRLRTLLPATVRAAPQPAFELARSG